MQPSVGDTIAALATPQGLGPIAIIRCTGPRAREVVGQVLVDRRGRPVPLEDRRVHTGLVRDPADGRLLDEVLVIVMAAPRSYTREDVVEIQGHGGLVQARRVLALLCRMGLRLALPGEFTRRAVLNGRIGLIEAEAIDDLIHAPGEEAAQVAMDQLHGALGARVAELRHEVVDLMALVEAGIDFPEEDIELVDRARLEARVGALEARMAQLASTYERGRVLRSGVRTLLAGRTNAGKSSLFNALLKTERAIVTEIPGTTRDVLQEGLVYRGVLLTLIDSAGLRTPQEPVEAIGIARSRALLGASDLVLYLIDAAEPVAPEDVQALATLDRERTIVVRSKSDLRPAQRTAEVSGADGGDVGERGAPEPGAQDAHMTHRGRGPSAEALSPERTGNAGWTSAHGEDPEKALDGWAVLRASTLTGEGLDRLLEEIHVRVTRTLAPRGEGPVLTSERQKEGLDAAAAALARFRESLRSGIPLDVALVDLYAASRSLGAIIGEVVTEDVLDRLFQKFCIGK